MVPDRFNDLRVLRWYDRIDAALAGQMVGPIRASIDLTNLCTHKCDFCEPVAFRMETIKDKNHTLAKEVVLEVLRELHTMDCRTINFSGGGEPTLHPDFGEILSTACRMLYKTWIVTHGGLMHKWMDELLLADHIRISLDASNASEHAAMHGTKTREYDQVLKNIGDLCARRTNGTPEVGLGYIVADVNAHPDSLVRVFRFADNVGVNFIHFRPLSEPKRERYTGFWERDADYIEKLAEEFPRVKCFPLGKRGHEVFDQREFQSCYADGSVCACCDERTKVFGNVNQQSFKSIWLSAKHRELAEKIVPKFCTRCLMCGYNRAVEKLIVGNESLPELL
jgi:MoaA/NifB/PqqE/SkfB family radical SAM enzyme